VKKSVGLLAIACLVTSLLTACASVSGQQALVPGSSLSVGESGQLASLNSATLLTPGSSQAASDLAQLTLPAFYSHDAAGELVANTGFGTVKEITSQDFSYTITGNVKWSDGVAVSPADLAVSWLAATDKDQPGFASSLTSTALALADKFTVTGNSVRLHFTQPIPNWKTVLPVSVPAHLLAKLALPNAGLSDSDAEKAVLELASGANTANRAALAGAFATSFNAPTDGSKYDGSLLVTAGAYRIKSANAAKVVLAADPGFSGGPKASVATVTLNCFSSPDELALALSKKSVDLAAPQATTLNSLAQLETKAKGAGFSTKLADSGSNEVALFNYGAGSAFTSDTWKGNAKKLAAVREGFQKFFPRAGIWSTLAGDSALTKTDSLVFSPNDANYQAAVNQNGSANFQFQDAESSAEAWQAAKFDRTVKIRVVFDANGSRGQLEYTQLSRLGKLGGFDIENASSDNPAAVIASGQWDVYLTELGRLGSNPDALATAVGALTGYQEPAVSKIVATNLPAADAGLKLAGNAVEAKNLDQLLVQGSFGLPIFELKRLVIWSGKLKNYAPATTNQSVVWGYSNWSVSASGK